MYEVRVKNNHKVYEVGMTDGSRKFVTILTNANCGCASASTENLAPETQQYSLFTEIYS